MSPRRAGPLHRGKIDLLLPQQFDRPLHVRVRDQRVFALEGQPHVFGQLKIRCGLDRGRELERLTSAKLNLLDVRVAHHLQLLFLHRFAIGIAE